MRSRNQPHKIPTNGRSRFAAGHLCRRASALLLLAALCALSAVRAASLADLEGNYSRGGAVALSLNGDDIASGDATIRFQAAEDGRSGTLTLSGFLRIEGVVRPFTNSVTLDEGAVAAISNLAPAYEDGYSAAGSYTAGSRGFRAAFPFRIGTTIGSVTLTLRTEKRRRATRVKITQTLTTSAILSPVIWSYSGVTRRR